jgi:hypothetical protein
LIPPVAPPADWGNLSPGDLGVLAGFPFTALDTTRGLSNTLVAGDPQTPIFRAPAGMPVRFRLVDPGGIGDNQQVFELTGHVWQEEPYTQSSTVIGHNPLSQWRGTTDAYGPTSHYNVVLDSAGGANRVPGDYLYRSWTANQYQVGLWGLFRVGPAACQPGPRACPDTVTISAVEAAGKGFTVRGVNTVSPAVSPAKRTFAPSVTIAWGGGRVKVPVGADGRWAWSGPGSIPQTLTATSAYGGVAVWQSFTQPVQATGVLAAPRTEPRPLRRRKPHTRQ